MAAIGIGHEDFFGIALRTTIAVTQLHLHLITAAFVHLKVSGSRSARGALPSYIAVEQNLGFIAHITTPKVPADGHVGSIFNGHQLIVSRSSLINFDNSELGFAPTYSRFAGRCGKCTDTHGRCQRRCHQQG